MNLKVIFIAVALTVVVASAAVLQTRMHFGRRLQTSVPIVLQTSPVPAVGAPTTTPSLITVNTPTTVTVSVQITGAVLPGGVNLLRLGATGTQPAILGLMHDDGLNGDAAANDGIYTLQMPFDEANPGQVQMDVSAAFRGALRRTMSGVVAIIVVSSGYTEPSVNAVLHAFSICFQLGGVMADDGESFLKPIPTSSKAQGL